MTESTSDQSSGSVKSEMARPWKLSLVIIQGLHGLQGFNTDFTDFIRTQIHTLAPLGDLTELRGSGVRYKVLGIRFKMFIFESQR